ncbi:hypothetical protein HMI54_015085 [Coelomomyces lativittatus]|nr:hypothetical protein HMI55_006740 [Coelomomyces lativittatus]KAJ1512137.1 hypothetical protein HMI56_004464 [Coelomomyces lativittatus]KAJ1513342.1 hypothetical protein HMI54_015085 [Coelomomyces lativittatus]
MEKTPVRRKQIDPALIEGLYNNNNNTLINQVSTDSSSITTNTLNQDPERPTTPIHAVGVGGSENIKSASSPNHSDASTSPNPSIITTPTIKPSSIYSGKFRYSPRGNFQPSKSDPHTKKDNKPQSTTKQIARKWLQGTKAFLGGITNSSENNDDEEQYLYFDDKYKGYLDQVCPLPPPREPPLYEYTPSPAQIFRKHHDLQLMYKVLKYQRDDLREEIKKLKTGTIADLEKEVGQLKTELQKEKARRDKIINHYEARIKGWISRYDILFNKWAKLEKLDPIFYYDETGEEDPVARAALKCHAFEREIQSLLQRVTHAVKKQPLDPNHPVQNPTLPKVHPKDEPILTDTFLSAIEEKKKDADLSSQQVNDKVISDEKSKDPTDTISTKNHLHITPDSPPKVHSTPKQNAENILPSNTPLTPIPTVPTDPLTSSKSECVSETILPGSINQLLPAENSETVFTPSSPPELLSCDGGPNSLADPRAQLEKEKIEVTTSLKENSKEKPSSSARVHTHIGLDDDILDLIYSF